MDEVTVPDPAGRTALVTGAGSGIGRAIALSLARAGARVALMGRRPEPLQRTAAEIAASEGEALPVPADVSDDRQVASGIRMAAAALGPVEILVNSAGAAYSNPIDRTSDADLDRLVQLNVRAALVTVRGVVKSMREHHYGRIVNIASTAAHRGFRYCSLYCATKHALAGLTRSLAAELLPWGITVNAVSPGYTDTSLVEQAAQAISEKTGRTTDQVRERLMAENPLGRLISPQEVAQAVLYLVGPASGAISGQALILDGGSQPR